MRNLKQLFEAMQAPELLRKYRPALAALTAPTDGQPGEDVPGSEAERVFVDVCAADPTANVQGDTVQRVGVYCPWLLDRLIAKELRPEQLFAITPYLQAFDAHKKELQGPQAGNIQTYKTLKDFLTATTPLLQIRQDRADEKHQKEIMANGKYMRNIPVNEGWKCWAPLTDVMAKKIGNEVGANWCTASSSWKSMYRQYVVDSPSVLFILKGPGSEQSYQTHLYLNDHGELESVVMHGKIDQKLSEDAAQTVRELSGFSLDRQMDLTAELTPLVQENAKTSSEGGAESSILQGKYKCLRALFSDPQNKAIYGKFGYSIVPKWDTAPQIRNGWARLGPQAQKDALTNLEFELHVADAPALGTLALPLANKFLSRDASSNVEYRAKILIDGTADLWNDWRPPVSEHLPDMLYHIWSRSREGFRSAIDLSVQEGLLLLAPTVAGADLDEDEVRAIFKDFSAEAERQQWQKELPHAISDNFKDAMENFLSRISYRADENAYYEQSYNSLAEALNLYEKKEGGWYTTIPNDSVIWTAISEDNFSLNDYPELCFEIAEEGGGDSLYTFDEYHYFSDLDGGRLPSDRELVAMWAVDETDSWGEVNVINLYDLRKALKAAGTDEERIEIALAAVLPTLGTGVPAGDSGDEYEDED